MPKDHWERINHYDIIVKVKIIKHIDYNREGGFLPNSITELKLIEILAGEFSESTMYFPNFSAASCGNSLESYNKNDELILKVNNITYSSYELKHASDHIISEQFYQGKLVTNDACDNNVLHVIDNRVKSILKKIKEKETQKYLKLKEEDGDKANEYFQNYIWNAKPNSYITYRKYKKQLNRRL